MNTAMPRLLFSTITILGLAISNVHAATFDAPIVRELTATSPTDSASADLNEDGYPDYAFAMSGQAGGDGGLSVVLSNGAGGYGDDTPLQLTSFAPIALTAADVNGDENVDLVAIGVGTSSIGRVQVFLGDGAGQFSTPPSFDSIISGSPAAVEVGLVNGDSFVDLLYADSSGSGGIRWMAGAGDGTFGAIQVIVATSGLSPTDIATADLDKDGLLDFATPEGIYIATGGANFTRVVGTGSEIAVAIGDMNNDGWDDVATLGVSGGFNQLQVMLNDRSGGFNFSPASTIPVTHRDVAFGEFDGDGVLDVAVTRETANIVSIYPGTGNGGLGAVESINTGLQPYSLIVNDTNNDGLDDIVVAHGNGGETPFIHIIRQNLPSTGAPSIEFGSMDFAAFESAGVASISARRNGDPSVAVTVMYASAGVSATAGQDYIETSGTLNFAEGVLEASFDVSLVDDVLQEGVDETVTLTLSNPTGGASIGAIETAMLRIRDDELPLTPGEIEFSASSYSGVESAASVSITIVRNNGSDGPASVVFETSDGSAQAGSDYQAVSNTINFSDGQTSATQQVLLLDDLVFEGNETIALNLTNATGATLGLQTSASLTIQDNEIRQPGILQFTQTSVTASETVGTFNIEVSRTGGSDGQVAIEYQDDGITAVSGQDYQGLSGNLVFLDGVVTQSIAVALIDDAVFEPIETFELQIFGPTGGATLGANDFITFSIESDDIQPPNGAPVANGDASNTVEGTAVLVAVLLNDTDPDGDTLSISAVGAATNGSAVQSGNNINYTPNANYNGVDAFTYTVTDGSLTDSATVTVTVGASNDAPVAIDDTANTVEDTAVSVSVLSNDTDPDGDTLSISAVGTATNGTAIQSGANINYTPNANFNGVDNFSYSVTDGSLTDSAMVTVTVGASNDVPVANDDTTSTTEDTAVLVAVLLNDTDPDGDTLSISAVGAATNGSAVQSGNNINYTPNANYNGVDAFTYTVTDGLLSDGATVTVTVDPQPEDTIELEIPSVSVLESTGTVTLNLFRNGAVIGPVTVDIAAADGTATLTNDYLFVPQTISFAGGIFQSSVVITLVDDSVFELDEVFSVTISNAQGADIGTVSSTNIEILNDDMEPPSGSISFALASISISEGAGNAQLQAIRTGGTFGAISAEYSTVNGSAFAADDFQFGFGVIEFADGSSASQTIAIPIFEDSIFEGDEDFSVTLSNPMGGASIGSPSSAVVTIVDNDSPPSAGVIEFSPSTYAISEADGLVTIDLTRSGGTAGTVSVDVITRDGSATAGQDYSIKAATVDFSDGQSVSNVNISVIDDNTFEQTESFFVDVVNPQGGASIGLDAVATIDITDDDQAPPAGIVEFSGGLVVVDENSAMATLSVIRTGGSAGLIVVNYSTVDGTAIAGSDYQPVSGSLMFGDGVVLAAIDVPLLDDNSFEGNEEFSVQLSSSTASVLGQRLNATVSVLDNELPPIAGSLSFSGAAATVGESDGSLVVVVVRSGGSDGVVGATLATQPGSAMADEDFTAVSRTIVFADGETTVQEVVSVLSDANYEGDETLSIRLSNATGGASIATPSILDVTIRDDDLPQFGIVDFESSTYAVTEGQANVQIGLVRTSGSDGPISVDIVVNAGSTASTADFGGAMSTIQFADGAISAVLSISIVEDNLVESTEQVNIGLANPQGGAMLGTTNTAVVTISDNDSVVAPPPTTSRSGGGGSGGFPLLVMLMLANWFRRWQCE